MPHYNRDPYPFNCIQFSQKFSNKLHKLSILEIICEWGEILGE